VSRQTCSLTQDRHATCDLVWVPVASRKGKRKTPQHHSPSESERFAEDELESDDEELEPLLLAGPGGGGNGGAGASAGGATDDDDPVPPSTCGCLPRPFAFGRPRRTATVCTAAAAASRGLALGEVGSQAQVRLKSPTKSPRRHRKTMDLIVSIGPWGPRLLMPDETD
jgi:hypothetical protein